MKDRLKELRKVLGLTQQEFADRIGIKRAAIANYEAGRNMPLDAIYGLIAREFRASEDWLRYGVGPMFSSTINDEVDAVVERYHLNDKARQCILKFVELSEDERAVILKYMENVVAAIQDAEAEEAAAKAEEMKEKILGHIKDTVKEADNTDCSA